MNKTPVLYKTRKTVWSLLIKTVHHKVTRREHLISLMLMFLKEVALLTKIVFKKQIEIYSSNMTAISNSCFHIF